MSRLGVVKSHLNYDDYSIARQRSRDFESILSPPEIEVAPREYSQRSESSGIPDGTTFDEELEAPLGESLSHAIQRMSRKANEVWNLWTKVNGDPFLSGDEMVAPIDKPLEQLMFDEPTHIEYIRNRRILVVEEGRYKKEETARQRRLVDESTHLFTLPAQPGSYDGPNRFYDEWLYGADEFGEQRLQLITRDRCKGKPDVNITAGIQISNIKTAITAPTYQDRLELLNLSDHETTVWRKGNRAEQEENFLPSTSPADDPDFIPPSSLHSRNFVIYPPASRPYNCIFSVFRNKKLLFKVYPDKKRKDYASLSSIAYILRNKGVDFTEINIHELDIHGRKVPCCRFEPDIRVTYGEQLTPDPIKYRKVDPESKLGQKFLQLLNEQPHIFKEYYFTSEESGSPGNEKRPVKKLAVALEVKNPGDQFGPRIYWVYVETKKNPLRKPYYTSAYGKGKFGKYKLSKPLLVPPQYTYHTLKAYKESEDLPNYMKKEVPLGATVRVSNNYYYYTRPQMDNDVEIPPRIVPFKEVEDNFVNVLESKGYQLVKIIPESLYSNVLLYKFIHTTTKTKQQRKLLLQRLEKWKLSV